MLPCERALKVGSQTSVKSDLAFCLGLFIEKTNCALIVKGKQNRIGLVTRPGRNQDGDDEDSDGGEGGRGGGGGEDGDEEEMDEEMDEDGDYAKDYFDNGEGYLDEDDDNLDEGGIY